MCLLYSFLKLIFTNWFHPFLILLKFCFKTLRSFRDSLCVIFLKQPFHASSDLLQSGWLASRTAVQLSFQNPFTIIQGISFASLLCQNLCTIMPYLLFWFIFLFLVKHIMLSLCKKASWTEKFCYLTCQKCPYSTFIFDW